MIPHPSTLKRIVGCSMARIQISNDSSGRIIVSLPCDPLFVSKVKTIASCRWHPAEKHWSVPNNEGMPERILEALHTGRIDAANLATHSERRRKASPKKLYAHCGKGKRKKSCGDLTLRVKRGVNNDIRRNCQIDIQFSRRRARLRFAHVVRKLSFGEEATEDIEPSGNTSKSIRASPILRLSKQELF